MKRWFQRWSQGAVLLGVAAATGTALSLSIAQERQPAGTQPSGERAAGADSPRANVAGEQPRQQDVTEQQPHRQEETQAASPANRSGERTDTAGRDNDRTNQPTGIGAEFRSDASGLVVQRVQEGGLAAQAGLAAQDRIVSIGGRAFRTADDIDAYLRTTRGQVPIVFQRDGRQYTVEAVGGQERGAWLGVYLARSNGETPGARLAQVFPAGPAARAGLRSGDVIVAAEGQPIRTGEELISFVESKQPRDEAKFTVQRGGRDREITARLASQDQFAQAPIDEGMAGEGVYGNRRYTSADGEEMDFSSIPEYAMQLEHARCMAEQNQRLEALIYELRDDVRELRNELLANRAGGSSSAAETPRTSTPSQPQQPANP